MRNLEWTRAVPVKVWSVLAILLTACSQPALSTVIPPEQKTAAVSISTTPTSRPGESRPFLTIALATNINSLEFPYAAETNSQNASRSLYDSLLYQAPDGSLEPALATEWEVSNDGKTYTFHLRRDVFFHNGEQFNADSVVFTWNTFRQPDVPFGAYFTPADQVEKIDDYAVQVRTREPNALMLPSIALAWMQIPPHYYREVGATGFAEHPVGTGPFVFQEWVKNDHLTVHANPNYWRPSYPRVAGVVFKFIPESGGRLAALKRGEIDIAPRLSSAEAQPLQGITGLQVLRYPVDRVYYVAFNNVSGDRSPTLDRRVRQAMNYAVDRRGIVQALLDGSAQLAAGFLGPADLGWDAADPFPYDPDRARQLLAQAGYGEGFTIDMACPNRAYTNINEVCEAIVRYMAQVGIQVNLNLMESNAFWELEKQHRLPALFADSWASYYREAYNRLQGALTSNENWATWYDPKFEDRIFQIGRTIDRNERGRLYGELQQAMRDDPPFIYLYYPETFEGVSSRVTGYAPRGGEDYYLWDVGLDFTR